jgi:hypothetical protein
VRWIWSEYDRIVLRRGDLTILTESGSVLNDVLAFIRHADEAHVTRLISLLEAAPSATEATT